MYVYFIFCILVLGLYYKLYSNHLEPMYALIPAIPGANLPVAR